MTHSVGKSILIYASAFAVAGATPFVLLPILTKALAPSQFGQVTAFLMLAALLANVAGLSTHGFVSVRYFKSKAGDFARLVGTALGAVVIAHVVAAALVAAGAVLLQELFDLPLRWMLLAVFAAACLSFNLVGLAIFQSSGQPFRYLCLRIVQAAFEIGVCILLLVVLPKGAGARIDSYTVALAASAALGAWWCFRQNLLRFSFDRGHLRSLTLFGLPLLPHIVAGTAISYLDRMVVSTVLGVESLGLYMAAMQIGMAMIALVEPLNKALAPWLFAQLAKQDPALRHMIVGRTYVLYVALGALGVMITVLAMMFFDTLVGPNYREAKSLVPWMVAGFVLQGMYYSVVNYVFFAERTGHLSLVSASVAVLGVVVSYVLTSHWGLAGAGVSFVVNNGLLFICVWCIAARVVPMPWFSIATRSVDT